MGVSLPTRTLLGDVCCIILLHHWSSSAFSSSGLLPLFSLPGSALLRRRSSLLRRVFKIVIATIDVVVVIVIHLAASNSMCQQSSSWSPSIVWGLLCTAARPFSPPVWFAPLGDGVLPLWKEEHCMCTCVCSSSTTATCITSPSRSKACFCKTWSVMGASRQPRRPPFGLALQLSRDGFCYFLSFRFCNVFNDQKSC